MTTANYSKLLSHIEWVGDAGTEYLKLLDQTQLPLATSYLECTTTEHVWEAIRRLSVRGAPAIGIAAAYGCVIGAMTALRAGQTARSGLDEAGTYLATSRPTAVNLFWAIKQMKRTGEGFSGEDASLPGHLLDEARRIHNEDRAACRAIGDHGLDLLESLGVIEEGSPPTLRLLTHCNAGALATGGIGTATAPMYMGRERGLDVRVYADETRPLMQGARLTAYELSEGGVDVTLLTDSMAGWAMRNGLVRAVITGADRIAANGDTANKVGTYSLAVLAKHHGIPFLVAAPLSTIDFDTLDGSAIPIEQREAAEITEGFGVRTAPLNQQVYSPAFDVTPAELITAIVTEHGVVRDPITCHTMKSVRQGRAR
ncbi:MAG: S-methyl-5-thioribose-1-phosphate isomerase [Planctomycetes bacterium]|nr:S-methyl-5-thioribose-1-phosphate isomerase [Planctomycetota bacterium]NOG54636.1 S-methyl-5-thioribose-1-phosphate isomerase [Planctomycetota bacterium]